LNNIVSRLFDEEAIVATLASPLFATMLTLFRQCGFRNQRMVQLGSMVRGPAPESGSIGFDAALAETMARIDTEFWESRDIALAEDRGSYLCLIWAVWAQVYAFGPLTHLAAMEDVTEILVKGYDSVYFEREGTLRQSRVRFATEEDLLALIERMAAGCGRRIDESQPFCDARLQDGSRMHAIIPPIAVDGASLTIRRFRARSFSGEELVSRGCMRTETLELLRSAVRNRRNILVSGGTGSGKTTLLNVLSSYASSQERIVTIEDSAELRLSHPHVVRLEGRPPNTENRGEITLRTLVRNALRMRPDRIIVGECRGVEAFDMLQAMNTGHSGSMTTIHANSAADALRRLEVLTLLSADNLELAAVREQIGASIELVVHLSRDNGIRSVREVVRVTGLTPSGNGYAFERLL
jgi:pilus assembly protein CpaF